MSIEDLLDDITIECDIEYRDMIMTNGGQSDSPFNDKQPCIIKFVKNEIDKSKDDEDKRISEATRHYIRALSTYNRYYDLIKKEANALNLPDFFLSGVIEHEGESITGSLQSMLKSVLEELDEAKKCLNEKEDGTSINFIDECISFIKEREVDRIIGFEKESEERKRQAIMKEREKNGLCIICGIKLGFFDKIRGKTKCVHHQ